MLRALFARRTTASAARTRNAHCVATSAALVLLTRAENDDAAGNVDYYPSLLALASTCHALWAAAAPRRARLAAACWLRAFGRDTLGPCAAWQRIEQLGGDAFQARWRWLHALRTGATVRESVVAPTLPNASQLEGWEGVVRESPYLRDAVDPATGAFRERFWHFRNSCFAAVDGGGGGAPLVETFVCCVDGIPYRVTLALRSGAVLAVEWSGFERGNADPLVAFGGIAAVCGRKPALLDLSAGAALHVLRRAVPPPPPAPGAQAVRRPWAHDGALSADGSRLALWEDFFGHGGSNELADDGNGTLHVYTIDADAPPGALAPAHTLRVPKFLRLAFGSSGAVVYTADACIGAPGTLRAHAVASGAEFAAAPLTVEEGHSFGFAALIAPLCCSELCVSRRGPILELRCTATLLPTATLQVPPLRGGHGERVCAVCAIGDVLLSCDEGGVLLAWHVPTRTLLRRLGRNIFAAPPGKSPVPARWPSLRAAPPRSKGSLSAHSCGSTTGCPEQL